MKNRVQKAAISDLEAVRRLNALLRTGVRDFYWDSDSYVRSAIAGGRCFLVKRGRGEVRGALIVGDKGPDRSSGQEHLVVETLVVEPGHRGRGIGTELVEFAKRLSFERDLRLYVESFYEYGKPDYYRNIGFKNDESRAYRGRPYHVLHFEPRPIPGFPRMKRLGIGDRLQYLYHLERAPVVSGDLTFERLFIHDSPSRKTFVSLLNDNVVVMERSEDAFRFYPIIGCSELDRTMLECFGWLKARGKKGWFSGVPVDMLSMISPQARTRLRTARERGNEEFLYRTSSLFDASAADPKAGKRNPDAAGKNAPQLRLAGASLKRDIMGRLDNWSDDAAYGKKKGRRARRRQTATEAKAVEKALAHSASLGLLTAGLYLGDALGGYAIAGINGKTAHFHFEEALPEEEARPAMLRLLGRELHRRGIEMINRRAKETALRPAGVIEKRSLRLRSPKR